MLTAKLRKTLLFSSQWDVKERMFTASSTILPEKTLILILLRIRGRNNIRSFISHWYKFGYIPFQFYIWSALHNNFTIQHRVEMKWNCNCCWNREADEKKKFGIRMLLQSHFFILSLYCHVTFAFNFSTSI